MKFWVDSLLKIDSFCSFLTSQESHIQKTCLFRRVYFRWFVTMTSVFFIYQKNPQWNLTSRPWPKICVVFRQTSILDLPQSLYVVFVLLWNLLFKYFWYFKISFEMAGKMFFRSFRLWISMMYVINCSNISVLNNVSADKYTFFKWDYLVLQFSFWETI